MADYDKVVKALEAHTGEHKTCLFCPYTSIEGANCMTQMLKDALALIREQQKQLKAHEWISVKDKLPEKYIDVLAWVTDPDPAFNDYIAVAWVKDDDGGWDSDSFSEDAYGTVTYWMPLPEPPSEYLRQMAESYLELRPEPPKEG